MRALAEKGGSDRGEDFEAAALFLHFDNARSFDLTTQAGDCFLESGASATT